MLGFDPREERSLLSPPAIEKFNMTKLLTRDQFRESVFERDNYQCVVCQSPAQDAHHILERRLFPDGGYYMNNGVSVCGPCHIKCEETTISCETVREAARRGRRATGFFF